MECQALILVEDTNHFRFDVPVFSLVKVGFFSEVLFPDLLHDFFMGEVFELSCGFDHFYYSRIFRMEGIGFLRTPFSTVPLATPKSVVFFVVLEKTINSPAVEVHISFEQEAE